MRVELALHPQLDYVDLYRLTYKQLYLSDIYTNYIYILERGNKEKKVKISLRLDCICSLEIGLHLLYQS